MVVNIALGIALFFAGCFVLLLIVGFVLNTIPSKDVTGHYDENYRWIPAKGFEPQDDRDEP